LDNDSEIYSKERRGNKESIYGNAVFLQRIKADRGKDVRDRRVQSRKLLSQHLGSNASKEWSGTKKELRKKREKITRLVARLLKQHEDEDGQQGDRKGGVDEEEKFAERIKRYEAQIKKLEDFDKTYDERMGSRGIP
jgi:hypothetical protein